MDPRLDKLKKYQIAIGTQIIAIEEMQTIEQAFYLYKRYVSDPAYSHENYVKICKKIEELFPEETFIWSLER